MAVTARDVAPRTAAAPAPRLGDRLLAVAGAGALAALVARLLYAPYQAVYGGTGADYVAFATGARLAGDRCLYCLQSQADAQAALLGYRPSGPGFPATFANAPLSAWVLHPIASLSLADGLRLFTGAALLATALSMLLARRLLSTGGLPPRRAALVAVAGVATLPGAMGLVLAQWTPLLLAAVLAGMVALRGGRPLLAGLLLSTLFIKPQDALLLLPALLAARSWRVAAGAALGGAAWWGSGFLLVGPSFAGDLVTLLRARQAGEGVVTAGLPSFSGFTPAGNAGVLPLALVVGAAALALLVGARHRLRGDGELAAALGIALSLLAAPHVFGDDLLLLVPAMVVLATRCSAATALGLAALLDAGYLADEHLLHTGPRAAEALCTLVTVVLLVTVASRDGARRHPRLARGLEAALAVPRRLLAVLEPAPVPAAAR